MRLQVASEGNRRMGDMSKSELDQCVLGENDTTALDPKIMLLQKSNALFELLTGSLAATHCFFLCRHHLVAKTT
jgi:hypothetical protein